MTERDPFSSRERPTAPIGARAAPYIPPQALEGVRTRRIIAVTLDLILVAGMSAALPGVAAAHTDLPVIGVPILGKSLGGAVAVDLAAEVSPAGLIVESSFASIPAMAAHHYPFVPRWFVRSKMDSLSKIGAVDCPVLVIHSPDDEIIPFENGRVLFAAAREPKMLWELRGDHNDALLDGRDRFHEGLETFLTRFVPPTPPPTDAPPRP